MGAMLQRMLSIFYTKKLEVVLVGLENSGKTTLMNVLAYGQAIETCPTIGLNVKTVKKNGVQMKCWDVGGQQQYRSEWGRYTRGCDVILYVVDTADIANIDQSKKELNRLLEDRELSHTPILILANKIDLTPHLSEAQLIKEMNLDYIVDNPWVVLPISALKSTNIEKVIQWLVKHGK